MGERCVTSKKRLRGRLPYFPTLIYFVSRKKLSVSKSNVMGLEFLKKYIVGFSHLDRASSIFTLFLKIPVRKDTLLNTQNSESVSLKTIPCSVAHNSLSQLRESPPSIQRVDSLCSAIKLLWQFSGESCEGCCCGGATNDNLAFGDFE